MGRDKCNEGGREKFTATFLSTMKSPAWKALSPTAQRLYPWVKLQWKGPKANNNGKIVYSVKQAADDLGCNPKTAASAFHDLQRKGFLVVRKPACLGLAGMARAPEYEITEIGMPGLKKQAPMPRKLFHDWIPNEEFEIVSAPVNNPGGNASALKPRQSKTETHTNRWNGNVPTIGTKGDTTYQPLDSDVPTIGTKRHA